MKREMIWKPVCRQRQVVEKEQGVARWLQFETCSANDVHEGEEEAKALFSGTNTCKTVMQCMTHEKWCKVADFSLQLGQKEQEKAPINLALAESRHPSVFGR